MVPGARLTGLPQAPLTKKDDKMNGMSESILEVRNISKSFPGVKALDDFSFKVRKGEVHALVGENGAGKSTMMKILNGNYKKDAGVIVIDGEEVQINNPNDAKKYGISIIFQELNLVSLLSVAENIFIGRLPKKRGMVDWKKLYEDTRKALGRIGYDIDPRTLVGTLSVAQRQMLEIARALSFESTKIILMDEPTATLTTQECGVLFDAVRSLRQQGISVIFISHKLEELYEICDTITVIRDGRVIDTVPIGDVTKDEITAMMVGREISNIFPKRSDTCICEREVLRVEGLHHKGAYRGISFSLREGEVLGLAGLVGAGRTEIARAIFGIDYRDGGDVYVDGQLLKIKDPADAIKHGICYLSEDRKLEGLMGSLGVMLNISAANLDKVTSNGLLNRAKEAQNADAMVQALRIKTPTLHQRVFNLSGGNMQKVVLAKWLNTDVKVFIFDEPTRGIDVGAKYEIYQLINDLVEGGKSVIMISSELPEIMGMCDRILVIRAGEISGEFVTSEMTANDFINNAI